MPENKTSSRIGIYIGSQLLSRCDAAIPKTNASSRSEFICDALEHYQNFIRIEQKFPDDKLYYRLGSMNLQGLGTEKDLERAEVYFKKAAILGNVDAVYGMGKLHLETDPAKAIRFFELAAKQGHTYAEYQLGKIFCFGIGVPRDLEISMEWLRLSAEHGNEHAATLLQHVKDNLAASATRSAFSLLAHLAQMIRRKILLKVLKISEIYRNMGHCIPQNADLSTACYSNMGQNMGQKVLPKITPKISELFEP